MPKEVALCEIENFVEEILSAGGSFSFMPKGISMLPLIREGKDSVIISPAPEKLKKYDIILYKRNNGKYVLHRIVKVKNGVYTLCGDNQIANEHNITKDMVLGYVTAIIRDGETIKNDNKKYKKYLRKLYFTRTVKKIIIIAKQKIKGWQIVFLVLHYFWKLNIWGALNGWDDRKVKPLNLIWVMSA